MGALPDFYAIAWMYRDDYARCIIDSIGIKGWIVIRSPSTHLINSRSCEFRGSTVTSRKALAILTRPMPLYFANPSKDACLARRSSRAPNATGRSPVDGRYDHSGVQQFQLGFDAQRGSRG